MSYNPSTYPPRRSATGSREDASQGERVELDSLPSTSRTRPEHTRNASSHSSSSTLSQGRSPSPPHHEMTVYTPVTKGPDAGPGSPHEEHHKDWDWHEQLRKEKGAVKYFIHRFTGKDRWVPWLTSVKNIALSCGINWLIIILPIAWVAHFEHWGYNTTFALCYITMMPLAKMLHFCGEQMMMYLGHGLGELLIITLDNMIEATLAIVLLVKCDLKLLQSTVIGVVILHLLLVPGLAFLFHGARIWEQSLHPAQTQLNNSLLTVGVLALLIPTAFFSALDRGTTEPGTSGLLSDKERGHLLKLSHGLAIVLLVIYIASRVYLHNPPGEGNALLLAPNVPKALRERERELMEAKPKANVWTCMIALVITVGLMATTAEFLVESVEHVREHAGISSEWFGIFLLPMVSAAADGAVSLLYYIRSALRHYLGTPPPPEELAKGRAIDLSIQFVLFWMPFLVLLGWCIGRPLHLMFDYYELAVLLGACFLVNHVTADAKTNWIEGLSLIGLYVMIVIATWYYPGQETVRVMLRCHSVLDASDEVHEDGGSEGGEGAEVAAELVRRALNALVKR